jgi:hypothetical protein
MGTDADGNPIDMSGVTGNTFEAAVAGDYVVVTGNPGCIPIEVLPFRWTVIGVLLMVVVV